MTTVPRLVKVTVGGTPRVVDLLFNVTEPPVANGFGQLVIRGGGFVTGLSAHSNGAIYARTDVGGAYRRDTANDSWVQIIRGSNIPSPHPGDFLVEAIGCAPGNSNVVYAAVGSNDDYGINGRVLHSTDGGETWTASARNWYIGGNNEWRYAGVRIAVDPDNPSVAYLGTRKDGLHYTTDGGSTWTKLTALPAAVGDSTGSDAVGVSGIIVDPTSTIAAARHQTIWAAVYGVGLCKSTNGGTSWSTVSSFTGGFVRDMVRTSAGNILACFYNLGSAASSAVRRITPGNVVTTITPGTPQRWTSIAVDPASDDRVVLAANDGMNDGSPIYRTTNGTAASPTWTACTISIANGTKGTVWPTSTDIEGYMSIGQLRFSTGGVLWFAEGMGCWRTTDLSDTNVTWDFNSDGIEELVANDICKPSGAALLTVSWDRGLFRHPNPTLRNPGPGEASYLPYRQVFGSAWDINISPTDPAFVVALFDDHQDLTGVNNPARRASGYSTDGGANWTRFGALAGGTAPSDMLFGNLAVSANNNDNIVWIPSRLSGTSSKIYYTTNRGSAWTAAALTGLGASDSLHSSYTQDRRILAAHPSTAGTFYAIGGNSSGDPVLWKSTNSGATWTKVSTTGFGRAGQGDFRNSAFLVIVPSPLRFYAVATPFQRSTDGATWTTISGVSACMGLGVGAPMTVGGNPALYTYATVSGVRGLHRSADLGDTWTLLTPYANDCHREVRGICGDPDVPGRVYVGFPGVGYAVGNYT